MIQLFIFDMAGTSVDEDNLVYKTIAKSLQSAGHEVSLETVLEYAAGKEKLQAITDVLTHMHGKANAQEAREIFEAFKVSLKHAYDTEPVKPIQDVEEVFQQLKGQGIQVALNTGYDSYTANKLLSKLDWRVGETVDVLVTASDVENGRPHPDMIQKAMELCGISDPKAVAKIGDSAIDIQEGHNAGCGLVLGITTGAQTEAQLAQAKPHKILQGTLEIMDLV